MRSIMLFVSLLGCAASASAQYASPPRFVTVEVAPAHGDAQWDGRTTNIGFDATVGGPTWRRVQLFAQGGRILDQVSDLPGASTTWYGAGGARVALGSVWRLRPYTDASVGFANSGGPAPLLGAALGTRLMVGRGFSVDGGYRLQRFFGNADYNHPRPYLGFGVTF